MTRGIRARGVRGHAHGVGPVPAAASPGGERAGADRVDGEHHVGVAQPAELGALPGNTPACGRSSVTTCVEPGIASCL